MKISVITPVYNGETMIKHCMDSVAVQTYNNKEHIIVDGFSSDNTVSIIKSYGKAHVKLLSEKDEGLYDAFNKGIKMANGDIICFLCADDMYAHENVLQTVASAYQSYNDIDMIFGDLVYVDRDNLSKVVRYWQSSPFKLGLFKKGWLVPHTALFVRSQLFSKYGFFNLKFKMASDYELHFRFFEKYKLKSLYIPGVMVRMRSGGISNSSLKNIYKSLKECYDALSDQNVRFPLFYIINTLFYRLRQTRVPPNIKRLNLEQVNLISSME
jgi:glycosyltransferase involved in cell wall biosynthesis